MLSLAMRRGLGAAAAAGTAGAAAWYNSTQLAACHEATPASEVDLSGVPQVWAENLREVLFTESQIDKRVREMAAEISKGEGAVLLPLAGACWTNNQVRSARHTQRGGRL